MKEASIIKVGTGEGLSKYLYTSATVAEVSIEADKLLQNSSDPEQTVSGHLSVLDSELDSLYLAISCGESVEVIREECTAAIARLVQIYQKAGDRNGETDTEPQA